MEKDTLFTEHDVLRAIVYGTLNGYFDDPEKLGDAAEEIVRNLEKAGFQKS